MTTTVCGRGELWVCFHLHTSNLQSTEKVVVCLLRLHATLRVVNLPPDYVKKDYLLQSSRIVILQFSEAEFSPVYELFK